MERKQINVNRFTVFILIVTIVITSLSFVFAFYGEVAVSFYLNDEFYKEVKSDKNFIPFPVVDKFENYHLVSWYFDSSFKNKIQSKDGVKTYELRGNKVYGKYESCVFNNWVTVEKGSCGVASEKYRSCKLCRYQQTEIRENNMEHNFVGNECQNCDKVKVSEGFTFEEINNAVYPQSNKLIKITGRGTCKDKIIVMPDEIDGMRVVEIAENAFKGDIIITELYISKSIKYIADNAFKMCINLEKVDFLQYEDVEFKSYDWIDTIGNSAFEDCVNLKDVFIHWNISSIGNSAFKNCTALTFIELFKNLNFLGEEAFANCHKLEEVYINQDTRLTEIKTKTFQNCYKLSRIFIPNKITIIGDSAFEMCINLEKVEIKNKSELGKIGSRAFFKCVKLLKINIPEKTKDIAEDAFLDCPAEINITQNLFVGQETFFDLFNSLRFLFKANIN